MVNRGALAGMEDVEQLSKQEVLAMLKFGCDRIFQVWLRGCSRKGFTFSGSLKAWSCRLAMCLVCSALLQRSCTSTPPDNLQSEARRPPSDAELDAIINRSSSRAAAAAAAEAGKEGGAGGGDWGMHRGAVVAGM